MSTHLHSQVHFVVFDEKCSDEERSIIVQIYFNVAIHIYLLCDPVDGIISKSISLKIL